MVVCSCRAVTDRAVRAAVAEGAMTVEEVTERCQAASDCGGCRPELERLVEEAACGMPRRAVAVA